VTKTRWIVEARNGHLKQIYKMFANPISTHHIKNLNDYLLIGGIINKYYGFIIMENANVKLARRMLQKLHDVNVIQVRVEVENLRFKRGHWVPLGEEHVPSFPQLSSEFMQSNLRNI